jgi:scyllo-inositol 2-dehydrogenase (NADP+)
MRKLNVAIIGQGRSGRDIHGRYFHTDQERFQVVAVVEALEDRRERAAEEYGCDTYEAYQELFGRTDIDLVVNASFSHMHAPVTIDLLNHGFHVLTEKPCARTPEEVQAMMDAGKKNQRMFAIFQQSRFAPYYEKVKSIIDSGVLGRIVQISISFNGFARRWDWQCCQEFLGGSLYNTGPHPMDQALNLLDYDGMPNVFCKMDRANTFGDAEDYVKVILTAPERPLIDVEISSCDAYPSFTYKVQGTRGGLKGDMTHIDWKYFSEDEAPRRTLIKTPLKDSDGLPMYCSEKLVWTEESWNTADPRTFTYAVKRFYDMIYSHLVDGAPLIIAPEQVKQQIAVINECHRQNPLSRFC